MDCFSGNFLPRKRLSRLKMWKLEQCGLLKLGWLGWIPVAFQQVLGGFVRGQMFLSFCEKESMAFD